MILGERIQALIEYSKLSIPKFAVHVGFKTPQAVREMLKGNTKTLSDSALYKITAAFPEINSEWLITGEGDMLKKSEEISLVPRLENGSDYRMVPIIHVDSVGGMHSGNDILSPEYIEGYVPITGAREGDLAIYQSGNSMTPAIPPGSILHIREVEDWQEYIGYGDVFVLLLRDDRRITKEIQRYKEDPKNYFWCVSYNPDVDNEELPKKMVRRVWKVIKVLIDKGW